MEVHRKGPNYRGGKDVSGQDYLDVFGFLGGEFGNWMNEKDRRASMNYGFDALKDLADAMGIADGDISLSGNLSIAFGARGQGLSGAAAHYERERHVINLTKMNGAGSLAHEWFHAMDDFIGGYGSNMATDSLRGLPERTKAALRDLLTSMQYRDATQEETDMAATKSYEQAKRSVAYQVKSQFSWVEKVENGTLSDADTRYYSRKPTAADAQKYHELLDKLLETGDAAIVDELSALRKEVNGRVIPKEDREAIGYRLYALKPSATQNVQKMRLRSDFYNNSRRFGELHQKDGDYWDSTVEIAARAFACYVADKTGKHNDYLSAHSDSAVTLDMDKNGNLIPVRAYPVGQERTDINAAFDRLIDALKADGFLHERGETVKPDIVQYQGREYLDEHVPITRGMTDAERYEILKDRTISVTAKTQTDKLCSIEEKIGQSAENAILLTETDRKKLFVKIGQEFGVFKGYSNSDVKLTFNFSKGNLKESVGKQRKNYSDFAKMLSCFDEIIDSAIGIEVHNRNAEGYKPDPTLKDAYVLISAFEDGSDVIPVKLEVKEFIDKDNSLYVAIALESIKKDEVVKQGNTENGVTQNSRSSMIRIADLFSKINPVDTSFLKYVPAQFLSQSDEAEQNQQRTNTLTDRDILDIAEKRGITETLSAGQVSALQIFNKKNAEIGELLKQKAKQEKILKDLQGTAKPDKQEIIKTQNRIKTMDGQIKRESAILRGYEATDTVKGILERVKPTVEKKLIEERKEELAKYGTIPQGEKAVRDDSLPVSTDGKNKVSRTARTVKGAGVTPDDFAALIDKEVYLNNGLTYLPITNNATVQKATEYIQRVGWTKAMQQWQADVLAGKASAEMSAIGALLLNNAAKAGDKNTWLDILYSYQMMGTNAAQATQALRILKNLQPDDKLHLIRKSIDQMVRDMHLGFNIEIDSDIEEAYRNAETYEEEDWYLSEIMQGIADQIPATLMDKWTALRYVNMLGNFRTQVRNVIGNLGMKVVTAFKDTVAIGLEQIAHKASGGKFKKTKSLVVSREMMNAAKADYALVESVIQVGGKYSDTKTESTDFARAVWERRTIFKNKLLEGYRKGTNWLMDQGDVLFSKPAYARALARYLKANGVSSSDFSKVDDVLMNNARLYAVKEAQEATFRDTNILSGWLSQLGRKSTTPAFAKVISEGIVPFRKTPANVLVRAEEYSPLGILNSVWITAHQVAGQTRLTQLTESNSNLIKSIGKFAQSGQEITGAEIINSWAKSLTGTGLFALGMLLHSFGVLVGGPDDDEDIDDFEALNGQQNYALKIGDLYITIDWLSPAAMPLFMGGQVHKVMQEGGIELRDIDGVLTSIADPMIQMSMLQGVNDTLENIRYAESNMGQLLINSAVSYLTQGLTNTMLGQLERGFEEQRMSTYVNKNSALPNWLQKAIGKASAKTPGLDYNQIPYINAWGQEEQNPETVLNLIYNMLSPSYISKEKNDAVSQELIRLNEVNSSAGSVFPSIPEKTIKSYTDSSGVEHKDYNLSAEEYVALAKAQGQMQRQIIESMISSNLYEKLPDEYKVKSVQFAYDYARESAQIEVLDRDGFSSDWMAEIQGNTAEGIVKHVIQENIKGMFLAGDISADEAIQRRIIYCGDSAEEAAEKVDYWKFQAANPDYADWSESTVTRFKDLDVETASHVVEVLDGLSPENGSTNVRTIQKLEAIAGDKTLLNQDKNAALRAIMDDKLEAKFDSALDMGISMNNFTLAYRKYLDTEGNGKKATVTAYYRKTFGISETKAENLYDLFAGKK